jgi:hypothetical protein
MTDRFRRGLCSVVSLVALAAPAWAQVDQQRAAEYFKEARVICERDAGRLWGISLCGPMVIADARTRTLATSEPRPTEEQPRAMGFANAPIEWGGVRWAAYVWDFIASLEDPRARGNLLLHELFHRVQAELGLMTQTGQNEHLDTVDGRVWLQLEWRALAEALRLSGNDRVRALQDALAFRAARRAAFPDAAENERVEEIREGLAQYTGTVATLTSEPEAVVFALEQLAAAELEETLVLRFAPTSGVAYGLLLDALARGWRQRVGASSDLGQMLMVGAGITPTEDAIEASARYGAPELRLAEQARYEQRAALVEELRQRFVEGPVLLVPSGGGGTFNTQGATPIPGSGTVYVTTFRQEGAWGTLETSSGVLVTADGARRLPGPTSIDGAVLSGDGWTVTVAAGWVARPGPRAGDYQIVRDAP